MLQGMQDMAVKVSNSHSLIKAMIYIAEVTHPLSFFSFGGKAKRVITSSCVQPCEALRRKVRIVIQSRHCHPISHSLNETLFYDANLWSITFYK